jgi:hypothetical protein
VTTATSSDYTLRVGTFKGQRVATLASFQAAVLKMADDYDEDGEHDIAIAFRLFAASLGD